MARHQLYDWLIDWRYGVLCATKRAERVCESALYSVMSTERRFTVVLSNSRPIAGLWCVQWITYWSSDSRPLSGQRSTSNNDVNSPDNSWHRALPSHVTRISASCSGGWCSRSAPEYGVRGPRVEPHGGQFSVYNVSHSDNTPLPHYPPWGGKMSISFMAWW